MILLVQEIVAEYRNTDEEVVGGASHAKLEGVGVQMGLRVAERLARDKPRFVENLEVVKFICKEFWTAMFKKQIDNLKTNHKGVFVLTDNSFRWTSHISMPAPGTPPPWAGL